MREEKINIYKFEELNETAKQKVLSYFRENNDYYFLYEYLLEFLKERLKEKKIKEVGITKLFYSLSYNQGDGCCFVGDFEFKNYLIKITHNFRYYHSKSVDFDIFDLKKQEEVKEEIYKEFKELYESICYEVEKTGYNYIENENSEEVIKENIEINKYEFYYNGDIFQKTI